MLDPEMKGWAIVVTNGVRLVGVLRDAAFLDDRRVHFLLEQALEFLPIQAPVNEPVPTGQLDDKGKPLMGQATKIRVVGWQLSEPLGYPSISGKGIPIPDGALVLRVNKHMSQADMNMLARGVDGFHEARRRRESSALIAGVQ
jgi:hypothetical protein